MIGRDPALIVTPADDGFHPPTSPDPSWIETLWFPFWIPEESISAAVRIWFSPNAPAAEQDGSPAEAVERGQQGGSVAGWQGESRGLFGDRWSEPFEPEPDLRDFKVGERLHIECEKPLSRYRIRHDGPHSRLDVTFDAIMPPHPVSPDESPGMFAGHFEQAGHVTGELVVGGKRRLIDCHSIRDRSWGPRAMPEDIRLGNAHGTSASRAFFLYVNPTADGTERITSGYLLDDGVAAAIVEGTRITELRDGLPVAVSVEARDAAGRTLRAKGPCKNAMASNAGHGVYAVLNLIEWVHEDGQTTWGENHDVWSEKAWLAAGRPKL